MSKEEIIKQLEKLKKDANEYSDSTLMNEGYRVAIMDAMNLVKKLTIHDVVKSFPTKEEIKFRAEQALFGFEEETRKYENDYYVGYCDGAEWIKTGKTWK